MHLSISLRTEDTPHSTPPLGTTILITGAGEQDQQHMYHINTEHHPHPTVVAMATMETTGQYTSKVQAHHQMQWTMEADLQGQDCGRNMSNGKKKITTETDHRNLKTDQKALKE